MNEQRMSLAEQWRMCTRKKRYSTRALAEVQVTKIWLAGKGHGLKVYLCRVPEQEEHWHVGHLVPWWWRHVGDIEDNPPDTESRPDDNF
jgi:hypothetical protein